MKWIKRLALALASIVALTLILAGLAILYSYNYIATPPVPDPVRELLSWVQPSATNANATAPWEMAARDLRSTPLDIDTFYDPPLNLGPWTRWWWPGNLVTTEELQREMQLFSDVALAGVEIQPFAIAVSEEDKASAQWRDQGWDSPQYYQNLHTVMAAAKTLGLGVDLNNGSGWPTGGPPVALEDGLRQLLHSELIVSGPSTIDMALPVPAMPAATFAAGTVGMLGDTPMQTFAVDTRQLVAVVAARIVDNRRSWQPWDFLDQIVLDPNSTQDITAAVTDKQLRWQAPEGEWAITALWQLPGGELVSGGYAHPQPGYVVDHLDAQRMRANQDYLFRPATGLSAFYGNPLRAFFNDSLEFRQERHWARGQLREFEARIGYDPRPWLAALIEPGKDQMPFHAANIQTLPAYDLGEKGKRFLEDWDRVISDLFRERYFQTLQAWGAERGLAHRLQAYGGPMDIIRAAGESDIPETEQLYAGGSEMFMKAVSSGAHIAGKPLVSAESFIFVGRAFMTTPLKIKALADKAFAAGINQLVYHGTAYRIEDHARRGYPIDDGWYPWQLGMLSTDYSENWGYWLHARQLNRYIARNQYLLRKGAPDTDVLVLYPGLGFPQGYTNPGEPFDLGRFDGEETIMADADEPTPGRGTQRMRDIWQATRELEQQGLTWEWVNEHALQSASYSDGVLQVGKLRARSLKLHAIDALAPAVAEHIAALATHGLPLQITGDPPSRQHGMKQWQQGDQRVVAAMSGLTSSKTLAPEAIQFSHPVVKSLRRQLDDGDQLQFFSNPTAQAITLNLTLTTPHSQAIWLDAWQGTARLAEPDQNNRLSVDLPAYGSTVLWLQTQAGGDFAAHNFTTIVATDIENWSLTVADANYEFVGALPGDWLLHDELRDSGGPGIYSATFHMPLDINASMQRGHRVQLELGKLYGAATVVLNEQPLGAALVPPYKVELNQAVQAGENTLQVILTPPRKNRLVTPIVEGEQGWNSPDLIGTTARVSAGLIGPVKIIESAPVTD